MVPALHVARPRTVVHRVERAQAAGFEALVFTVDNSMVPNREWDTRNGFTQPIKFTARNVTDALLAPRWLFGTMGRYFLDSGGLPKFVNVPAPPPGAETGKSVFGAKNTSLTWDDVRRLRDMWTGPLLVKGLAHPDDARLAADCGADGLVVSNHGGIANDASIAPIDALPGIAVAVGDRMTILVDSGIRRGSDIVKALALGADAVMVGRATLYGTAAAGEAGAARALEILHAELERTMGVIGAPDIASITRDHVFVPPSSLAAQPAPAQPAPAPIPIAASRS